MSKKTMDEDNVNEEFVQLELGFEDHGILLDMEVGDKFRKILEVKNLAHKNLARWKEKVHMLRLKRSKSSNTHAHKDKDMQVPTKRVTTSQATSVQSRNVQTSKTMNSIVIHDVTTVPTTNTIYPSGTVQQAKSAASVLPQGINLPLTCDLNSEILSYQGSHIHGYQLQGSLVRPIVQPNVITQSFSCNPTFTVVNSNSFTSPSPATQMMIHSPYYLDISTNELQASSSVFKIPRIIKLTSILPTASETFSRLPTATANVPKSKTTATQTLSQLQKPTATSNVPKPKTMATQTLSQLQKPTATSNVPKPKTTATQTLSQLQTPAATSNVPKPKTTTTQTLSLLQKPIATQSLPFRNYSLQIKPVQQSQQSTLQQQRPQIQQQPRQTIAQQQRLQSPLIATRHPGFNSEQSQQKLSNSKQQIPSPKQYLPSPKQNVSTPMQSQVVGQQSRNLLNKATTVLSGKNTSSQVAGQQSLKILNKATTVFPVKNTSSQVAGQQSQKLLYKATSPSVLPVKNISNSSTVAPKPINCNSGTMKIIEIVTIDDGNDVTDNNKTFPSLVVPVKPCLIKKPVQSSVTAARAELDSRVKVLITYTPPKLIEWLMQRRLLLLHFKCTIHVGEDNQSCSYQLGLYNDKSHPYSGGYVWVAECCRREKEISVFKGSIFESSIYPPMTLLKLIYHWSCQTPFRNVLQWVKVSNYYLKNFYTLLRSVCVAGLHKMCPLMGGPGKYVEIAIITLGTTKESSTGTIEIKVEFLGVFDPAKKIVRMKVINVHQGRVKTFNSRTNVMQCLRPVSYWVDKNSTLLIDRVIDKSVLELLGFNKIVQSRSPKTDPPGNGAFEPTVPTNLNAMNYLKFAIPKMFQSTLCVLSKSLIQQFLDELSWREIWGGSSLMTFENIINQLAEMTTNSETGESLIHRLNQISDNPFEESSTRNLLLGSNLPSSSSSITNQNNIPLSKPTVSKDKNATVTSQTCTTPISKPQSSANNVSTKRSITSGSGLKRKFTTDLTQFLSLEPKNIVLQSYYYGTAKGNIRCADGIYGKNISCPICLKLFTRQTIMAHIYQECCGGVGGRTLKESCAYCLKDFTSKESLVSHELNVHTLSAERFCCRICQLIFSSELTCIIHMWENHEELEMPYICNLCGFRSSMHTDVVDHIHKEHSNCDYVICPLCMKTFSIKSLNCIKQIVIHFESHSSGPVLKCPQCTLVFPEGNDDYRKHIIIDGAHRKCSSKDCKRYILSFFENATYMPKPPNVPTDKFELPRPSKMPKLSESPSLLKGMSLNSDFVTPIDPNGTLTVTPFNLAFSCAVDITCLECNHSMKTDGHFTGFMKCNKCPFATCCGRAMTNHHANCHSETGPNKRTKSGLKLNAVKPMDVPLNCSCGFSSRNPYHVAEHLVLCEQSTAYPD